MTEQQPKAEFSIGKIIDKWFPSEIGDAGPTERILATVGRGVDGVISEALRTRGSKIFLATVSGGLTMHIARDIAVEGFTPETAIAGLATEAILIGATAGVNRVVRAVRDHRRNR